MIDVHEFMGMLREPMECLITFDEETGRWVGECLNLRLVTSAKNEQIVWENLKEVIRVHLEVSWRREKDPLEHRSSRDKFVLLQKIKETQPNNFRSDKIRLNLDANDEDKAPVWVHGVELAKASAHVQAVH